MTKADASPPLSDRFRNAWDRFWFAPVLSQKRLGVFRVLFFGLLSFDMVKLIPRAARYGSDGFNVAHFPALDAIQPAPTRIGLVILFTLGAYLAGRIAFGSPRRWVVVSLALIYGAAHFCSQLDSFQHHYLLFLLLVIASFVPWQSGKEASQWAVRLFLVQVSAVYMWAAAAKLEPLWLDGTTLDVALREPWIRDLITSSVGWSGASISILLAEVFLAFAIHIRKLRWPALVLGFGLHLGIELSNFKIDLFSYYMFAVYGLLSPVPAFVRAALDSLARRWDKLTSAPPALILIAGLVACGLLARMPFAPMPYLAATLAAALLVESWLLWRRTGRGVSQLGLAHNLAIISVVFSIQFADVARDHYRFLGGSLRRFAKFEQAKKAYRKVLEVDPAYGPAYATLGDLTRQSDPTAALVLYLKAQKLAPNNAAGFSGAAKVYHERGQGELAVAAAKKALTIKPKDRSSNLILKRWQGKLGP